MLYINSFCIMYSVCICSWWWDVHTCIYFISSVVFADFLIKSSFKKSEEKKERQESENYKTGTGGKLVMKERDRGKRETEEREKKREREIKKEIEKN